MLVFSDRCLAMCRPLSAEELLRWMDAEKVNGFINWAPFKHPSLGDVEIGGFRPYALSNPDASKIAELGKGHLEFVTYLSSVFPKVSIADSSFCRSVVKSCVRPACCGKMTAATSDGPS